MQHPPTDKVFTREKGAALGSGLQLHHDDIVRGHAFYLKTGEADERRLGVNNTQKLAVIEI